MPRTSRTPSSRPLHKGDYMIIKYNLQTGNNGDLIVGEVKSVRTGARIELENLLTGHVSLKKESILLRRNVRVPKKVAMRVVAVFRRNNDRAAARAEATRLAAQVTEPRPQPQPPAAIVAPVARPARSYNVTALVSAFRSMPDDRKKEFSRHIISEMFALFELL